MTVWKWCSFSDLSGREVYEMIQLRERVFIAEQNCAYLDADGKDFGGWHLLGFADGPSGELHSYLRVLPPGLRFPEYSIGRVVVAPEVRRQKCGEALMQESFRRIQSTFGSVPIRISAQAYLQKFYERLGFAVCSDLYQEDGIPHLEMFREWHT